MPRHLRIHFEGAIHHVTNRGVDRQPIFLTDRERARHMQDIGEVLPRIGASLLSFCLMSNHEHLLIRAGVQPISAAMQEIFSRHSSYFNFIHGRTGHLYQGRHHSKLCKSDRQLVNTVAYIHLNPVEAGIATHPKDWTWSSHVELVDGPPRWIDLSRLSESTGLGPEELREAYLDRLETKLKVSRGEDSDLIKTAAEFGVDLNELREGRRGGAYTRARIEFIRRATARGVKEVAIAQLLGCSRAAVSQLLRRV